MCFFFSRRRFGNLLGSGHRPYHFASVLPSRYSMGLSSCWQKGQAREMDCDTKSHQLWPALAHRVDLCWDCNLQKWESETKSFLTMCLFLLGDLQRKTVHMTNQIDGTTAQAITNLQKNKSRQKREEIRLDACRFVISLPRCSQGSSEPFWWAFLVSIQVKSYGKSLILNDDIYR